MTTPPELIEIVRNEGGFWMVLKSSLTGMNISADFCAALSSLHHLGAGLVRSRRLSEPSAFITLTETIPLLVMM